MKNEPRCGRSSNGPLCCIKVVVVEDVDAYVSSCVDSNGNEQSTCRRVDCDLKRIHLSLSLHAMSKRAITVGVQPDEMSLTGWCMHWCMFPFHFIYWTKSCFLACGKELSRHFSLTFATRRSSMMLCFARCRGRVYALTIKSASMRLWPFSSIIQYTEKYFRIYIVMRMTFGTCLVSYCHLHVPVRTSIGSVFKDSLIRAAVGHYGFIAASAGRHRWSTDVYSRPGNQRTSVLNRAGCSGHRSIR